MDKRMMILVSFFSVATFISSIITSCLVFYNEKARTDINSNKVIANADIYKSSSINYYNNNKLNLSNLEPGANIVQKFSITNNNSNQITYNIEWNNISSDWDNGGKPEELIYSISCTDGQKITNKQMPTEDSDVIILDNQELKTNKTNECTMTVNFKSTGQDQSYNLNKTFKGEYKIVIKE